MKTIDIINILKSGKKPLVTLTGALWDDSWGEKGMIARVVSFRECNQEADNMFELSFDYNEYKDHNFSLQSHSYFLRGGGTGTAFQAGIMKQDDVKEDVYFMVDDELPFSLNRDNTLLNMYCESGAKVPYVEWLENFIMVKLIVEKVEKSGN